jgi:hypothetical protein
MQTRWWCLILLLSIPLDVTSLGPLIANPMKFNLRARLAAEFLGSAFLVAAVIGSGIMGERLAARSVAIALLANTIASGGALLSVPKGQP